MSTSSELTYKSNGFSPLVSHANQLTVNGQISTPSCITNHVTILYQLPPVLHTGAFLQFLHLQSAECRSCISCAPRSPSINWWVDTTITWPLSLSTWNSLLRRTITWFSASKYYCSNYSVLRLLEVNIHSNFFTDETLCSTNFKVQTFP